jgi:predicted RecA/RadA family phage recombinase
MIESYDKPFQYCLAGTGGTAGDLMYLSTGSVLTYKSASTGTGVSNAFLGVLVNDVAAAGYCAIEGDKVVQLEKHTTTNKIEMGDVIYGTKSSNLVGTLAGGTALGICAKQSSTADKYVQVKLTPYYKLGAGGFHA